MSLTHLIRFRQQSKCFKCGKTLDASRQTREPIEGDISVCFYCGNVMLFDKDLKLRQPSDEELSSIMFEMQIEQPADYAEMRQFIQAIEKSKGH